MDAALGASLETGKGVGRIVEAGVKSPMNFCMGLAKGFRNAPRLYNDETVRKQEKVTGLASGVMLAGKEFGLGLYDGITGLVTQPYKGAEKEGVSGLIKGIGKGIGGIVLKPQAGETLSFLWLFAFGLSCCDFTNTDMVIIKLFRLLGYSRLHNERRPCRSAR